MEYETSDLKDYRFFQLLKKGGQAANIELWRHARTGELVVTKGQTLNELQINNHQLQQDHSNYSNESKANTKLQSQLETEAEMLAKLHRYNVPGLVPFKGIICNNDDNESKTIKCIALGYCNMGDLSRLVKTKTDMRFSEDEASKIIKSLVHTLKCCHASGIMHRDIKLDNVFLIRGPCKDAVATGNKVNCSLHNSICSSKGEGELNTTHDTLELIKSEALKYHQELQEKCFKYDYEVVLGDFGLATHFKKPCQLGLSSLVGTLDYVAPEVIQGEYDERADIWSLGVVLHYLLTGSFPFQGHHSQIVMSRILKQHINPHGLSMYCELSATAKDLMARMLDKNPKSRISLEEIEKHKWIVGDTMKIHRHCSFFSPHLSIHIANFFSYFKCT